MASHSLLPLVELTIGVCVAVLLVALLRIPLRRPVGAPALQDRCLIRDCVVQERSAVRDRLVKGFVILRIAAPVIAVIMSCSPGSCVPAVAACRYCEATRVAETKLFMWSNSLRTDCEPLSVDLSNVE